MPTPLPRAICCAKLPPEPPPTPITAACWCAPLSRSRKAKPATTRLPTRGRLHEAARFFDISTEGKDDLAIAGDLADFFMTQFAWSEEPNATLKLAPEKRQALWKKLGISPNGIDSAVVELMHRTHMGVDHDYKHLIMAGLEVQPGRRLGGLSHRYHSVRHPVWHSQAGSQPGEPGRAGRRQGQYHRSRA